MRFVVDMNLSPEWTALLRTHGHDAQHWLDIGRADAPDDEILSWAASDDRIVLTADLDFGIAVATRGLEAPTVVQLRLASTDPLISGDYVARSIAAAGTALCGGAILTIDPRHARLRPGYGAVSQYGQ